jgi:dolichol-phosphate mannosyltransferase
VLDEAHRLGPCLEALSRQGQVVRQILVADGGSTDGTRDMVRRAALRDPRISLVEAGAAPAGWNGKVWGLQRAADHVAPGVDWLLSIDADVRPADGLADALVARAEQDALRLLSVATAQRLSGPSEALLHPALLTTLVYRFGRPNTHARTPAEVLANGQCCLVRRDLLAELGGFASVRASLCEDITLARRAVSHGDLVGFFEAPGLVEVGMFGSWREAWDNWPRSLTTRDDSFGWSGWLGLAEVLLLQAAPLPLLLAGIAPRLNRLLLSVRLGILVGTARAYPQRPLTFWLSPLLDVPAAAALVRSSLRREHRWRGRAYTQQHGVLRPS